jgi:hypothetical protein
MKEFYVDLKVDKQPDGSLILFGKETSETNWPPQGRAFARWMELLSATGGALERDARGFDILRTDVLRDQLITTEQLHRLRLPNFNMAGEFPSYQGVDFPPDDDPEEE